MCARIARIWIALLCMALLAAGSAETGTFAAAPTVAPPVPLRRVRIRAVGDLMAHKEQLYAAYNKADDSFDFHEQYALIASALANADYTIANLETTIGKYGDLAYSGYPMFNTPEALLDTVRDAGIDFLTLANNHMLDRYFEGMVRTVDNVEKYGFDHGGANRTPEEKEQPVVVEVNGVKIGFLCYTQMTNGMEAWCDSAVTEYGVNYLKNADFAADVQKLRDAGAEAVIALPHWGEEYFRYPDENTKALAKKMIAAGVDVILGSHAHMVQPVAYVEAEGTDGEMRRGLVAYCLGNFISNMTKSYTDSGIILEFTLLEKQDGSFEAVDVGIVPVFCWHHNGTIQAVPSAKYYEERPKGMSNDAWNRMKATCRSLYDLMGGSIPFLEE